jgi:hypothetical protein
MYCTTDISDLRDEAKDLSDLRDEDKDELTNDPSDFRDETKDIPIELRLITDLLRIWAISEMRSMA